MKGIVKSLHVLGLANEPPLPGTPLRALTLREGLTAMTTDLSGSASEFPVSIKFTRAATPIARLRIGDADGEGLQVGADGWRALLGASANSANWGATPPFGAALAATLAATEALKRLLTANGAQDPSHRFLTDLAYSAFNYGLGAVAAEGPELRALDLRDTALVGCGAGGSAALYVLGMQPGLTGDIALIEPGCHKLSNINRYLATSASDVHERRHKLASLANYLARFAPALRPKLYPCRWEQLDEHPWSLVLSAVDTIEARWSIQGRCAPGATILDGAVIDLLYSVLRVTRGGWCLECKHPYDAELAIKQRAARWGQTPETIRIWSASDRVVTADMLTVLAQTQNRDVEFYEQLLGMPFNETPRLTECGETMLRADVPSQAPVLPVATTAVGVFLAAEIAKHHVAPEAGLENWVAHDMARSPEAPRTRWRTARSGCPRH